MDCPIGEEEKKEEEKEEEEKKLDEVEQNKEQNPI